MKVCLTGQHPRDLLEPLLDFFRVPVDLQLQPKDSKGNLASSVSELLRELESHQDELISDGIIVQGHSSSALTGAYFGFSKRIPVSHVDAGLRTHELGSPFPEEAHRQMISRIAAHHFSPTKFAARNLRAEGIDPKLVQVVGSPCVDALMFTRDIIIANQAQLRPRFPESLVDWVEGGPCALVTIHRRENQGLKLERILVNLIKLLDEMPDLRLLVPVHPNPAFSTVIRDFLGQHPRVLLTGPLPYVVFVYVLLHSKLVITDSGSIQEEAPTLRVPTLILRDTTEHPEGIEAGFAKLIDMDRKLLIEGVKKALIVGCEGRGANPYGDGHAAKRIARRLANFDSKNSDLRLAVRNTKLIVERKSRPELKLVYSESLTENLVDPV